MAASQELAKALEQTAYGLERTPLRERLSHAIGNLELVSVAVTMGARERA